MTRALVLLAHGAGVPSSSPWMQAWKARLGALGEVVTFDYAYARAGRKSPDPHDKLLAAHRAALDEARAAHPGLPVVLAGKSMGGRIGCHLALEPDVQPLVRALVCLGYPLVAPGASGALRDEVLVALRTPVLFVQGTRDRLCPLDRLAGVRARMKARNALHVVEGGDHSLVATKGRLRAAGLGQEELDRRALAAIVAFCTEAVGAPAPSA